MKREISQWPITKLKTILTKMILKRRKRRIIQRVILNLKNLVVISLMNKMNKKNIPLSKLN